MLGAVLILIPVSVVVLIVLLAALSARLGAVLRRPPHYRWFFVAAGCIAAGAAFWIVFGGPYHRLVGVWAIFPIGLIAVGLLIGLLAAWSYWSWLLYE
jgi:hypothetical protein